MQDDNEDSEDLTPCDEEWDDDESPIHMGCLMEGCPNVEAIERCYAALREDLDRRWSESKMVVSGVGDGYMFFEEGRFREQVPSPAYRPQRGGSAPMWINVK